MENSHRASRDRHKEFAERHAGKLLRYGTDGGGWIAGYSDCAMGGIVVCGRSGGWEWTPEHFARWHVVLTTSKPPPHGWQCGWICDLKLDNGRLDEASDAPPGAPFS